MTDQSRFDIEYDHQQPRKLTIRYRPYNSGPECDDMRLEIAMVESKGSASGFDFALNGGMYSWGDYEASIPLENGVTLRVARRHRQPSYAQPIALSLSKYGQEIGNVFIVHAFPGDDPKTLFITHDGNAEPSKIGISAPAFAHICQLISQQFGVCREQFEKAMQEHNIEVIKQIVEASRPSMPLEIDLEDAEQLRELLQTLNAALAGTRGDVHGERLRSARRYVKELLGRSPKRPTFEPENVTSTRGMEQHVDLGGSEQCIKWINRALAIAHTYVGENDNIRWKSLVEYHINGRNTATMPLPQGGFTSDKRAIDYAENWLKSQGYRYSD